jgi:hypothetical protein
MYLAEDRVRNTLGVTGRMIAKPFADPLLGTRVKAWGLVDSALCQVFLRSDRCSRSGVFTCHAQIREVV